MRPLIDSDGWPLEWPYWTLFKPGYWISRDGQLYSTHSGKVLGGYVGPNGYLYYTFKDGTREYAHRLVAMHFLEEVHEGQLPQVNHKNHNRLDNRVENLEWVTPRQNNLHAHTKAGRKRVGSFPHPNSKLTKEQAIEIFLGKESQLSTAKKYGVSARTVHDIRKGLKYSWATKEVTRTCAL